MSQLAIIGGTGLTRIPGVNVLQQESVETPYGPPSSTLTRLLWSGREIVFLARHGDPHRIPPHQINYRANLWALKNAGATEIVAVAAVGGIEAEMRPGELVVPDQIIDYTYGREHSFSDGPDAPLLHVDFTEPYSRSLRKRLLLAADAEGIGCRDYGVYGATQGPRLESRAEIDRMARDGCTLVGMTGMPEAGLARELDLEYACLAVVVNLAAGRGPDVITMEDIHRALEHGMVRVQQVLGRFIADS